MIGVDWWAKGKNHFTRTTASSHLNDVLHVAHVVGDHLVSPPPTGEGTEIYPNVTQFVYFAVPPVSGLAS